MKKKAGIMGTAAGLMKKPAIGALKSFGKYELATATGGLAPTALSLAGSATGSTGLANMGSKLQSKPFNAMQKSQQLKGQASQFGQTQDRNSVKTAGMNMKKLNKTFNRMEELSKNASDTNWKQIAGMTAMGTVIPIAIGAGIHGAKKTHNHFKAESVWKKLKKEDPSIDTSRDRENFEVLKQFGSGLAHNKTTARSFLDRTRNTYTMPHEFVGDLVNTQDKLNRDPAMIAANTLGSSAFATGLGHGKNIKDREDRLVQEQNRIQEGILNRAQKSGQKPQQRGFIPGGGFKQASLSDVITNLKEELNDY
jgi:hypothetical protein